jgi:hypothetical protein
MPETETKKKTVIEEEEIEERRDLIIELLRQVVRELRGTTPVDKKETAAKQLMKAVDRLRDLTEAAVAVREGYDKLDSDLDEMLPTASNYERVIEFIFDVERGVRDFAELAQHIRDLGEEP